MKSASLAKELDSVEASAKGRGGGLRGHLLLDAIMGSMEPEDRDSCMRALTDRDQYGTYRVSVRRLADLLQAAGHNIGEGAIYKKRRRLETEAVLAENEGTE